MKTFVRDKLPWVYSAARIVKERRFELMPPRVTYAMGELHRKIEQHFPAEGGTFFEVGANNGVEFSNTAYLEKHRGWRGILVEAVPHKFVQCVQNRPRARCYHAALVPHDYTERAVEIVYSNLMSATTLSEADVAAHVEDGARFLGNEWRLKAQTFLAPAMTVDAVLKMDGYPTIDFFSIDVEGAELPLLRGIDFSRSRPKAFLVEISCQKDEIFGFLQDNGYGMTEQLSFHDYLFRPR